MAFELRVRGVGEALLAIAATALMVWFGTGLFPMWPLMWFAPLPVLLFAGRGSWQATGIVAAAAWAIGSMNLWHYFRVAVQIPLAGRVMIVAAPALVFTSCVLLHRALLQRRAWWSALLAVPAGWVSFEYVLNLASPHGTANNLAYSQLNCLPVLQLASITGPWGISFLLLMFSSALSIGFYSWPKAPKIGWRIVGTTLSVVASVVVCGSIRLASPPTGQTVKVGLVASDLPENRDVAAPGVKTDRLLHDYEAQAEMLAARGAQAIVLPEHLGEVVDATKGQTDATENADAIFQPLADRTGATIVVGLSHVSAQNAHNEARIYQPAKQMLSYDKHHLLPPFESRFAPGTALTTLVEPKGMWGVAICKDMDFTQLSRQYGEAGVGLLLVPAWDFVLDRIEHGHMAIMRAVESGFGLVRAARGGYLTVTDNRGRVLGETQSNSAPFATLLVDVPAIHDRTVYLVFGDWFAWVTLGTLVFVMLRLGAKQLTNALDFD